MREGLRWFGLITLFLSTTTSNTAGFGSPFGDLDLTPGRWQRMFARSSTFPWDVHGNSRGIRMTRARIGYRICRCLHPHRFNTLQVVHVVQFLDFGRYIGHGRVGIVGGENVESEGLRGGHCGRSKRVVVVVVV